MFSDMQSNTAKVKLLNDLYYKMIKIMHSVLWARDIQDSIVKFT